MEKSRIDLAIELIDQKKYKESHLESIVMGWYSDGECPYILQTEMGGDLEDFLDEIDDYEIIEREKLTKNQVESLVFYWYENYSAIEFTDDNGVILSEILGETFIDNF